jgi:hypothetical protein
MCYCTVQGPWSIAPSALWLSTTIVVIVLSLHTRRYVLDCWASDNLCAAHESQMSGVGSFGGLALWWSERFACFALRSIARVISQNNGGQVRSTLLLVLVTIKVVGPTFGVGTQVHLPGVSP